MTTQGAIVFLDGDPIWMTPHVAKHGGAWLIPKFLAREILVYTGRRLIRGSLCGAGAVRGSFLQGSTKCSLGALVLLRQTNCNACPIGIRWVRPSNINALREHRCRELR